MKTIRNMIGFTCLLFVLLSCTKDNFINTGISNGRFDGTTLEYMEANPYDWSMTVEMIRHVGDDMVALFSGKDAANAEITFLGITNHSIRRYLLENKVEKVTDLDADWCRTILLQHVIKGKVYRKDIAKGTAGGFGTVGEGGTTLETLAGTSVWLYIPRSSDDGVIEYGAKPISMMFTKSNREFWIASADLEQDNGMVHSLEYKFTLGEEEK